MNVLTLGTFDLFHAGHVNFLRTCREIAVNGRVTVALNTDRFAASYKRPPVIDYQGRKTVLEACRYVDKVVPNDQTDGSAWDVVLSVQPGIIAASEDWRYRDWFGQVGMPEAELAERLAVVRWVPYTAGISSSELRSRL